MAVLFAGCGHQAPQRPSQRKGQGPQVDSAALALLQLNQQLAETADRELTALAQEQDSAFALYEAGTWMRIMNKGDETTPTPQANEEWTIRMCVYDLKMQLLEDSEASYRKRWNRISARCITAHKHVCWRLGTLPSAYAEQIVFRRMRM